MSKHTATAADHLADLIWAKVGRTYLRSDGSTIERTSQGWVGRHTNGAPAMVWPTLWAAKDTLDTAAQAWAEATAARA